MFQNVCAEHCETNVFLLSFILLSGSQTCMFGNVTTTDIDKSSSPGFTADANHNYMVFFYVGISKHFLGTFTYMYLCFGAD